VVDEPIIQRKSILTRTIPLAIAGIVAFVVYLLFFVDINEMVSMLSCTKLPIFTLAAIASVLEMIFFALTWQFFLKPLSANVPLKRLCAYTWISNFIDFLIPAESISGEISRIVFIVGDGVNTGKAAASVITQRMLGLFMGVGTLAIGAVLMLEMQIPLPSLVQSLVYLIISVTVIFIFLMILIFTKERWAHKIAAKTIGFGGWITRGRLKTNELKEKVSKAVVVFYESLRVFRAKPATFVPPLIFALMSWLSAILVYYLAFAALGYSIDWIILIVGYSIVVNIKSIPFGVPAEIGVTEIAMTVIFGAFNVPLYISAAAVVLTRIINILFRFVVGFVAFQFVGVKTMVEFEDTLFHKK
jgi:uncharacterized protein (TIRG00374 family)